MSFFQKSGIVNVKMVITEEKILSNIDKIQKLINPNSKKQMVQLEEDTYFKDLVESIKTYLIEYPKKKNFPVSVYKASYDLIEYATGQFEENTKKVEELIRNRERNIKLADVLSDVLKAVENKSKNWKEIVKKAKKRYPEDVVEALKLIGTLPEEDDEYQAAKKLIQAKIGNLESNMFIEIDIERIEDKSKALSYIGIEIAEALKYIPAPIMEQTENTSLFEHSLAEQNNMKSTSELLQDVMMDSATEENEFDEASAFFAQTRFEAKPSLWQRIKNCKLIRTLKFIMKIKVVLDYPALPEGRGE